MKYNSNTVSWTNFTISLNNNNNDEKMPPLSTTNTGSFRLIILLVVLELQQLMPGSHKVLAGMDSIKNYLLHVHDDVNCDIIFFAQLFGVFVCALLYWLQEYYSASFEGYFVIFLPFIPAVLRQFLYGNAGKIQV